jgi:hypothetical protein
VLEDLLSPLPTPASARAVPIRCMAGPPGSINMRSRGSIPTGASRLLPSFTIRPIPERCGSTRKRRGSCGSSRAPSTCRGCSRLTRWKRSPTTSSSLWPRA